MKFEYEYKDDPEFKVKFEPAQYYQWNIVKETYGEKGQKLVGKSSRPKAILENLIVERWKN